MFVVSNAGPLMVLAKLHRLHLLKALYDYVHIASSVYREVVSAGLQQGHEDARTLALFLNQTQWKPENVTSPEPNWLPVNLDQGERDTLVLANMADDTLVLMDELIGRQVARTRGFRIKGSLGILVEAHQKHLINTAQLRLSFAEIVQRPDIWIAPALVEQVLKAVISKNTGEEDSKDRFLLIKETAALYTLTP